MFYSNGVEKKKDYYIPEAIVSEAVWGQLQGRGDIFTTVDLCGSSYRPMYKQADR